MKYEIYCDDCLSKMKDMEDNSINLVLIDPPYNIGKDKWDKWKSVDDYVEFMGKVFKEIERVLKPNGSFYFFHNDFPQMAELQIWIKLNTNFVFRSLLTITKKDNTYVKDLYGSQNHFRNFLSINEYCLFYTFQDDTGLSKIKFDVNNFSELRKYFETLQKELGVTKKTLIEKIGQRVDHCFRWSSSQWDMPTKETYEELIKVFNIDDLDFFKEYETLRQEYETLRQEYETLRQEYESSRYTFNNYNNGIENSLSYYFRKEKRYNHPTQKPTLLLEDIIKISSNENDVVLDCFMGSGSTGVACMNTNRQFVGIELDEKYFEIAKKRIEESLK